MALAARAARRAAAIAGSSLAWGRAVAGGRAPRGEVRVSYGLPRVPRPDEPLYGGIVKFQRLAQAFPPEPVRYNVLYLGSSTRPWDSAMQIRIAKRKGAAVAWNQNGVAYPGWHGPDIERTNAPMRQGLLAADHVFYQSAFCKETADRFVAAPGGPWEVLHNSVDTRLFAPELAAPEPRPLVVLLGGTQNEDYRLRSALETLAYLTKVAPDARLLVSGKLAWGLSEAQCHERARSWARELGVADRVEFLGPYAQSAAPALYRRADILLHTKYKDPCPSVVVEALACGRPVVHSASGGVPELVGHEAGVGLKVEDRWDRQVPVDPGEASEAIIRVADHLPRYAQSARRRAVEHFDVQSWIERHRRVFERLVG